MIENKRIDLFDYFEIQFFIEDQTWTNLNFSKFFNGNLAGDVI
jgi:hypothetical protein